MNSVQILGTITRDIELKYTQGGVAIGSFGIAYNEKRKQQDGSYGDVAHFFDLTAFGKTAENINQYFNKGSRILIQGSLDFQSWTNQQGEKRSKVGIKVEKFDFIDRKDGNQSNNTQANNQAQQQQSYQQPAQNQQYQAPQPTYEVQGKPVTQNQYNQNQQQAQVPPVVDINEDILPF